MIREMNFDYEQLAKKILERIQGSITAVKLQTFVDEYIAFVEGNRAPKTVEGVRLVCKHLLRYFSPIRKIDTIKLKDAECFLDSLKKNAPKAIHNYLHVLRAMWNKAIEWNYLRENPFAKIKLEKRQYQKPVFVTEKMLEKILKYINIEIVRDAVLVAFYTGLRLGEIVNLIWQIVNLKEGLLTIGSTSFQTKSRKQRIVPIHPKVKKILTKRFPKVIKKEKHYVFCKSNGYAYTGDFFSKRLKEGSKSCRNG